MIRAFVKPAKNWFWTFVFLGLLAAGLIYGLANFPPRPSPTVVFSQSQRLGTQHAAPPPPPEPALEQRPAVSLIMPDPNGPCDLEDEAILFIRRPYIEGPFIKVVQSRLQELGFYHGVLDGVYGPETASGVAQFQRSHGFKPTGNLDLITWLSLGEPQVEHTASSKRVEPRPKGKIRLLVDLTSCTLTVYDDDQVFRKFPVAIGREETPTPIGMWTITQKDKWGEGFGSRWMKLSIVWGKYGIHGTDKPQSIGWASSHGCVRMFNRDIEILYEWVQLGTQVKIVRGPLSPLDGEYPALRESTRGSRVQLIQRYLKEAGFDPGSADGIWGPATTRALKNFQSFRQLKVTGYMNRETYEALGFINFE